MAQPSARTTGLAGAVGAVSGVEGSERGAAEGGVYWRAAVAAAATAATSAGATAMAATATTATVTAATATAAKATAADNRHAWDVAASSRRKRVDTGAANDGVGSWDHAGTGREISHGAGGGWDPPTCRRETAETVDQAKSGFAAQPGGSDNSHPPGSSPQGTPGEHACLSHGFSYTPSYILSYSCSGGVAKRCSAVEHA